MREAFICDAIRTPFGRYGGELAQVRTDDLAAISIQALVERNPSVDWAAIDDVIYGCVNQAGEDNRNVARMALLLAGLPQEVAGATVNRLCGSGMDAVAIAARTIRCGEAEIIVAGGVESMSRAPFVLEKSATAFPRTMRLEDSTIGWRFVNPRMKALYGTDSMAETAENLASERNIGRADQDAFALRSQQRTAAAKAAGFFDGELVPVHRPQKRGAPIIVAADEHPRPDATAEGLAMLPAITRPGGTVTAGNASGVNDGACALLIASAEAVRRYGLTPKARFVASAVAGVAPRIMGIGPVGAVQKVLARTGLSLKDVALIELNEAFAAQALAVTRSLGLPDDSELVNPNGGAIALGHPLGASGARLVTTATRQLARSGARYAICTMCIGVGQGIAVVLERA